MKEHRPHGPAPTKWEADLLKLRAFEMVLVLFYVEDLKRFILKSIKFTKELQSAVLRSSGKPNCEGQSEESKREGKQLEFARRLLVVEGVISQAESDELFELVDYRNTVAHKVQQLTVDVGAYSNLTKFDPKTYEPIPPYDYSAAKRAKQLSKKISNGMARKFVLSATFNALQFEAAERTYVSEIEKLRKRVSRGINQTNKIIADTNKAIANIPKSVMDSAQPGHPRNFKENGTLSKQGARCVFQLYEAKATPLAVAYLMRISHRATTNWFRKWNANKA
jgi:hypothetical protein